MNLQLMLKQVLQQEMVDKLIILLLYSHNNIINACDHGFLDALAESLIEYKKLYRVEDSIAHALGLRVG